MPPPLAPSGINEVFVVPLHSIKSDTRPEIFLISKQVVPYQSLGGTCCPGGGGGGGGRLLRTDPWLI
jgi:hypothetical protein